MERLDYWSALLAKDLVPVLSVITMYLVLGTVGNLFVMYVYWIGNKVSNEERFFIPILALCDFCASVVCAGAEIVTEVNPLRFDSDVECKLLAYFSIAFVTMSSHLLLVITIDRFLKICRPFSSQMTLGWKKFALCLLIIDGILVSAPSVKVYGAVPVTLQQGNVTGRLCINVPSGETRIWHLIYKTFMMIYGSIHFLVLVVLYILIIRSIYIQSRSRVRLTSCQWQYIANKDQIQNQREDLSPGNKGRDTTSSSVEDINTNDCDKASKCPKSASTKCETSSKHPRNTPTSKCEMSSNNSIPDRTESPLYSPESTSSNKNTKDIEYTAMSLINKDKIENIVQFTPNVVGDETYFASSEDDDDDKSKEDIPADISVEVSKQVTSLPTRRPRQYINHMNSAIQPLDMADSTRSCGKSSKVNAVKGLRLTLIFLIITMIYVVTLCLKLIMMTMESANEQFWMALTPSEFVGFRFLYNVYIINHIVNPFVYGFLDRHFQRIVRKRCKCR